MAKWINRTKYVLRFLCVVCLIVLSADNTEQLRALGMFEGQLLPFVISLYASITITTLATADVMLLVVFLQSHDEDVLQEAASGTDMDGRKAVMNVCHKYSFSEPSKADKVALQTAGVEMKPLVDVVAVSEQGVI